MSDTRYPHLSDALLEAVDWFTDQMKRKLEENSHKGDSWRDDDTDQLAFRVRQEADELMEAAMIHESHPDNRHYTQDVIDEAADTANMSLFTAARVRHWLI